MNFSNFNEAYYTTLDAINAFGINSSPRGRKTRELIAHKFTITNPTQRLLGYKTRQLNIYYALGNFLWVMAKSNELEFIEYYNPRGRNFSDDLKHLRGAYGKRIFDFDGINQFHLAINELKLDKDSRRALISIHMPQHDWSGSLDTPCTADFQLLIRENKLHMINHMRSQSAAMVMPYDIFLITMLHEYASVILGVELGQYIHICNSLHFFEDELELINKIFHESKPNNKQQDFMPKETNYEMIKKLLYFEKDLREEAIYVKKYTNFKLNIDKTLQELKEIKLPTYWHEIGLVLIAKALSHTNDFNYSKFIDDYLHDTPYQYYLK